jgi:hypothetical protein
MLTSNNLRLEAWMDERIITGWYLENLPSFHYASDQFIERYVNIGLSFSLTSELLVLPKTVQGFPET